MPRDGRQPEVGLERRACAACGTEFQPYRSHQIACSRPCRERTKEQSPRRTEYGLTCKMCGASFTAMWTGMGRQPSCESCTAEIDQAKRERHNAARRPGGHLEEISKERTKKYNLYRYNLTVQELEAMLVAQNGVCAICGSPPTPGTGPATKRLHVDHDHDTKKVRALLCNNCNRGLGWFKDDPSLLRAAADYIDRHRE